MQCVEFESRLNDLLDERVSPGVDDHLLEHAQGCPICSELLAAHELLLEGVQGLPTMQLCDGELHAFADRVVAEVGSQPAEPFRAANQVELAKCDSPLVAKNNTVAALAIAGFALATAAAVLIAVLPRLPVEQPGAPADNPPIVGKQDRPPLDPTTPGNALTDYEELALFARVGYEVADGLTPVTNSMVSALRELRKRPFFRNSGEPQRSSFYSPRGIDESLA